MTPEIIHASCVAIGPDAALITGKSGAGKSALALQMMAFGAQLVADDRTVLNVREGQLFASVPDTIRGMIEARKLGLIQVTPQITARIALVVDLDQEEPERLPEHAKITLSGVEIDLVRGKNNSNLAAQLIAALKGAIIR